MMNNRVGYRFSPTEEELINYYLKNKILGNNWLVDDAISEINIYSCDPKSLPSLSKIESNDLVWYFFCRNEYISTKQRVRKRTTVSGFWKATGRDRTIKDKGGEIGMVKTLVYHKGRGLKGVRTTWVMHEYHITCLPLDQRTYVVCKIKYSGDDFPSGGNEVGSIPSGGNEVGSIPSGGNEVGGIFPSGGDVSSDLCPFSVSDLNSIAAPTITEMDIHQQSLPSVQTPVVDSNTVRAANFEKMYKLLQNLPSVEIQEKLK
ncbi:NAC domain-containing protein [Hirschfeldia incana]|nr:NAC domain-containing protein [Hirschfeldia incana]